MLIQPRRALLKIWQSILSCSLIEQSWGNPGRDGGNSISDAEQLVCLLYPALKIPVLDFSVPDATEPDVLKALSPLGDFAIAPKALAGIVKDYLAAYSDEGRPVFPPGSRVRPLDPAAEPSPGQEELETVEAYSMSVTFSLSALAFIKSFAKQVRGEELTAELRTTEAALDRRLTHAIRGLLDSFAVDVFRKDSPKGATLLRTLSQRHQSEDVLVDRLRSELQPIRAGLRGLSLQASVGPLLADEELLFQCGWSWGPVRSGDDDRLRVAEPVPALYFTVTAMDGIVDFFSRQTLLLGLLSDEQQALAHALRLRWELTQSYWTALARFGGAHWPLADPPWRPTYNEGEDSDYATLQVASVVVHNLMHRHGADDVTPVDDLTPLAEVLEELAARGGITRRPLADARTVELHDPGELVPLPGSERCGPALGLRVSDYAPMLLKRMLQLAGLTPDLRQRDRLLSVADDLVDHLWHRRLARGPAAGLWDAPEAVYAHRVAASTAPSWDVTERVVEVLVVAATAVNTPLARSTLLAEIVEEILRDAEQLYAQEVMRRPVGHSANNPLDGVESALRRARDIASARPGVAVALAIEALRELDYLALARDRAVRGD
ncbi:SCO2524 family protein [Streptomyces xylophagus]|uniref:SCO2524 family protein n=1 Tax=Streptomyces xylophagus TaxID=285514 RepID=UPI0005BB7BE7|nr:SCO2524 family protein [Streptomyces xylophagus]